MYRRGFTMVEILVVVAIIGILASVAVVFLTGARGKANDARRKAELGQIGRLLTGAGCFQPENGAGTYDLADLIPQVIARYPQAAQYVKMLPRDPRVGSDEETFYRYIFGENNRCAIYANLENDDEPVTLPDISVPTPGGGTGVFESSESGWNGTRYLQISD